MKSFYTFLLLLLILSLNGEIPEGYYDGTENLSGESLKNHLHSIIDNHTAYSYSRVWTILQDIDEDPSNQNNVKLFYTGWSLAKNNHGGGISQWNREHVWAKSHGNFGTATGPGTDVHHLHPTDVSVNSARGSKDFDIGGNPYIDPDGETGCFTDNDSWEPNDNVKGDVARTIFYMATRYETDDYGVDLELNDNVENTSTPYHGKLSVLLQWNEQDPVSEQEIIRNNKIYTNWQHNRNPFIDHPEFANLIWGNGVSNKFVNFSQPNYTFSEENENVEIEVVLSEPSEENITFNLNKQYNNASGLDIHIPSSVTIPANSLIGNIAIHIVNDNINEGQETLSLSLQNSNDYQIGEQGTTLITIEDTNNNTDIISAKQISHNCVILNFNNVISNESAIITNNFSINNTNPNETLHPVENDGKKILLIFSEQSNFDNQELTINNLYDCNNNIITTETNIIYDISEEGEQITENFNSGTSWDGYSSGDFEFSTGIWVGEQVFLETNQFNNNNIYEGTQSIRINDDKPNAFWQSPSFSNLTSLSFYYAALHDENEISNFEVFISENNNEFVSINTTNYSLSTFNQLNLEGNWENAKIKIINNNQPAHLILDYFTFTTGNTELFSANFTSNYIRTQPNHSIKFVNTSIGEIDSIQWDFNNDGNIDSSDINPTFSFQELGSYDVRLIISHDNNTDEIIKENFITISATENDNNNIISIPLLFELKQNPIKSIKNINLQINNSRNKKINVGIYNLKGKLITQKSTFDNKINFHTDIKLANGIYFIKADDGHKTQTSKLMILK